MEENEQEDDKLKLSQLCITPGTWSQEKLASKTATHLCATGSISESFDVSKGSPG